MPRPSIRDARPGPSKSIHRRTPMVSNRKSSADGGRARPRVLVLAEAANPEWVSVPLVGWSFARAIAREVDAHLVTQVRNRDAILRAGLIEGRDFTSIDSERVARPLNRVGAWVAGLKGKSFSTITALETLAYYEFERLVWRRFGAEIKAGQWELVHRVTPTSPVMPSPIAARCSRAGVPFVIGPLNGGVPWPRGFEALAREDREWLTRVRGMHKWMPAHRSTRAHAAVILVGSRVAHAEIAEKWRSKCVYMPENGVAQRTREGALHVIFVGRIVPLKGVDLLLEAVAPLVRDGSVTVEIVGDGRQRAALEEWVRNEKLGSGVTFSGWLSHARASERIGAAHMLALPSVREFGGGVVIESMAAGAVPIVLDHGGPPELVSPATGIVVPLGTRAEIVANLHTRIAELASDRERLETLASRGIARAREHFTWGSKAARLRVLYESILDPDLARPHFPMPIPDETKSPETALGTRAHSAPPLR